MNVRKIQLFSLCMLLVLGLWLPALTEVNAASKTVMLKDVKGEVIVKRGGGKKEIRAIEGMSVTQGDSIRTGKNSSVKINYDDKNETLLGSDTQILFSELVNNSTVIKLSSGSLWNKVKGTMNANDRYDVETPTSIMGVRGTLFMVQVGGDGRTNLSVLDGIVGINRPNSGSSSPEQAVNVDEQVSTGSGSIIPTPSPLDIPQFVQETDIAILVQIILDELESSLNREQRAAEYERLYESLNLPDHLTGAVEEAHLASLLAHIDQAIMREIEQSTRYQEVEQAFRDQGISWQETYREVRNSVEQAERKKAELERIVERDKISQDRQEQLRRELQEKIDRHRSGQSTSPSPTSSAPPPSSGGDGGGGTKPTPGTTVTATFNDGIAMAEGIFKGINYTIFIPQQMGDEDGGTISFTLHNPPSIPPGAGPVNAMDIRGLEGRDVLLTMSTPETLSHEPQAYHYEGNGRWEPRYSMVYDNNVTFETTLSAVAVGAKIRAPEFWGYEVIQDPVTKVELSWLGNGMEEVTYQLFRYDKGDDDQLSNGKLIHTTAALTENAYTDTDVSPGNGYVYKLKAVRSGFESEVAEQEVIILAGIPYEPTGAITGVVTVTDSVYDSNLMIRLWDKDLREVKREVELTVPNGIQAEFIIENVPVGEYRITVHHVGGENIYENYVDQVDRTETRADFQHPSGEPYMINLNEGIVSYPPLHVLPLINNIQITPEPDNTILVSWDAYYFDNGLYRLYVKDATGNWEELYYPEPEETSYLITNLSPDATVIAVIAWPDDFPKAAGTIPIFFLR